MRQLGKWFWNDVRKAATAPDSRGAFARWLLRRCARA